MFTPENTTGYTAAELAKLNAEWDEIVAAEGLEPESDEYIAREKQHADEVSRRIETMRILINELDQTIVDEDLATYKPPNEFIRELIDAARETGDATRHDPEGCPVTASIR